MPKDYFNEFLPDLEEFQEKTIQFHKGDISVAEYKRFSGGFGSYAQRGGRKHMLRLRMAGGRLTKERLKFIAESLDKYEIGRLKMTTCQSIQLHDLEAGQLCALMKEAWQAGMISRGGGGDFPRNVMATPLSGLQKEEYFDVMPYAVAAGEYLMGFIKAAKFPRKLKVCFSSRPENETHATFRDLGFVAGPNRTFDIYAAGGLGIKPSLGICVARDISPDKILYYIKAMVETFVAYGNYENRARSRTRFMAEELGEDGFRKAYLEKLEEIFALHAGKAAVSSQSGETLELSEYTVSEEYQEAVRPVTKQKSPVKSRILSDKRIVPQKQEGLYAVFYQPTGGMLTPAQVIRLYHLIKPMEDVGIRLTPEEGLYVVNCSAAEAEEILSATKDSARTLFETSVACVGASVCQVGIGDSQTLLNACIERVRREGFSDGVLPQIHISGCPSSCGTHQIGKVGFRGGIRQTPDGPRPAFAIFTGGCPVQGKEVLADMGKSILAEDIPEFLAELGRMVEKEGMLYEEWAERYPEKLEKIIEKYTIFF